MSRLSAERKVILIETLFERPETEIDLQDYQTYFETLDTETQYLNDSRDFRELYFRLKTEQLVSLAVFVVPKLRRNPSSEQGPILDGLQTSDIPGIQRDEIPRDRAILEHILDGIVRIWLMVDPSHAEELHNTGWRGRRKLCDFVHGVFYPGQDAPKFPRPEATTARDHDLMAEMASETTQVQSCLTHPLTVSNLKKLTNITTYWITHLEKHMEFDSDYSNLSVFAQNRWLLDARDIVQKWRTDHTPDPNIHPHNEPKICPFPVPLEVIHEAIRSLDLLFPRYNIPTNRFLKANNKNLYSFRLRNPGDIQYRTGSKVRLKEFIFYHDRVIELAQEFINPPKNWDTIFRDYRNPIQYWTFWIGLVIFIATVVSAVLAGVQVYYAQHSA